ncbi:hypothetical protein HHI36_000580 [Cryptolaemus montrouzieri]|uniref:Sphingomyelin phosphodiesterase n=1 Tax=Cryptolaemus montrouzieri TaxID=559131 RepID=A0ABD2P619_9CUCU
MIVREMYCSRLFIYLYVLSYSLISISSAVAEYSLDKNIYDAIPENFTRNFLLFFAQDDDEPIIPRAELDFDCHLCDEAVSTLLYFRKNLCLQKEIILNIFILGCEALSYNDHRVCVGKINSTLDQFLYIIDNAIDLTPQKICALKLIRVCQNQLDFFNWTIPIPEKPNKLKEKIASNDKNLRILQLSDPHVDVLYTPGARADCGETVCCQFDQKVTNKSQKSCGVWGEYSHSDIPKRTFFEALRHSKLQENIDFVYFTGDSSGHRTWSWNTEDNSAVDREVMSALVKNFDVPVFFVLGNHDPFLTICDYSPTGIQQNISTDWLFDILKYESTGSLSDDSLKTIQKGGYYTSLLKPGLRLVVLNDNVCSWENLWLLLDDYDPYGQLTWLVEVLAQAEKDGEYVHLLYHQPTATDWLLQTCSRELVKIITRFSDTISAQFNGHTHFDEFFVFYEDVNSSEVINVAFNGASLSPFTDISPSYKIYDIDSLNYKVLDFEEWTFNLTAANLDTNKTTVDWYKLYSFKEAYNMPSMDFEQIGKLTDTLATNRTLLEQFYRFRYRMGPASQDSCDDNCYKEILCRMVTSYIEDEHCQDIEKKYDKSGALSQTFISSFEKTNTFLLLSTYSFLLFISRL